MTTFCWLPPLSVEHATSGDAATIPNVAARSRVSARSSERDGTRSRIFRLVVAIIRFSVTLMLKTSPWFLRSPGT